jgi:prepilin peptidase CpaA
MLPIPPANPADFLWFLLATVPIAIWVSWSDMKHMKIPNKAVLSLAAVWAATGWLAVPLDIWLWGFALMGIVLVVGFVVSSLGLVGAGDAKFAAAMAPFFTGADIRLVMMLFAACLLAAFTSHRLAAAVPAVGRATADWVSFGHKKFPMGLALAGTLIFHPFAAQLMP